MSQERPDMPPEMDAEAPEADGASPAASRQAVKVELDIDDAPFLQDAEEAPAPVKEKKEQPEASPKKEPPAPKAGPGKLSALLASLRAFLSARKKLVLIAGGGALALVLIIVALLLFLGGGKEEAAAPPPPEAVHAPVPAPVREDAPAGPKYLYTFEPFFMERRGQEGEIRFLRSSLSIPTDNPALYAELRGKSVAVRDAVYYYFMHKSLIYLSDPDAALALKQDLISVINENLSTEKIQELFIEEYFISGR